MSAKCNMLDAVGFPCGTIARRGFRYCVAHENNGNVRLFDSVYLPEQFGEELWKIIALDLQLQDLRSLYLTCKTLFWIFTDANWFSNHPVYVVFSEYIY